MAEATGGGYRDAGDAAELAETVQEAADEAGPQRLEGAPFFDEAETGEVGVTYTDTVGGDEVNFYTFDVTPDTAVAVQAEVSAMVEGPQECELRMVEIELADQESSDEADWITSAARTVHLGTEAITTSGDLVSLRIRTAPGSGSSLQACPEAQFDVSFRVYTP